MSRTGTAAWWAVLVGALLAIAVGFAGGRSYGNRSFQPRPRTTGTPLSAEMEPREFSRILRGSGSLAAADDDSDRYGDPDRAVAARPAGWAPSEFDGRRQRARVAVLVVDADRAASALAPFAAEPFPLAILIAPERPSRSSLPASFACMLRDLWTCRCGTSLRL